MDLRRDHLAEAIIYSNALKEELLHRVVQNCLSSILFSLAVAVVTVFVWSWPAFSEVYQWTDENGQTVYSDSPPPGVNPKLKKLRVDRIERPEIKERKVKTVKEIPDKKALRDITVILYYTDW